MVCAFEDEILFIVSNIFNLSYDYLFYYPRKPLMGQCLSYPTDNEWNKFFGDLAK